MALFYLLQLQNLLLPLIIHYVYGHRQVRYKSVHCYWKASPGNHPVKQTLSSYPKCCFHAEQQCLPDLFLQQIQNPAPPFAGHPYGLLNKPHPVASAKISEAATAAGMISLYTFFHLVLPVSVSSSSAGSAEFSPKAVFSLTRTDFSACADIISCKCFHSSSTLILSIPSCTASNPKVFFSPSKYCLFSSLEFIQSRTNNFSSPADSLKR